MRKAHTEDDINIHNLGNRNCALIELMITDAHGVAYPYRPQRCKPLISLPNFEDLPMAMMMYVATSCMLGFFFL